MLVEQLVEPDVPEALAYLQDRVAPAWQPTPEEIEETLRARDEAMAPDAVLIPNEAMIEWMRAWGTPDEGAADARLDALVQDLGGEPRGRNSRAPCCCNAVQRDLPN